jgi:hypothetical protein
MPEQRDRLHRSGFVFMKVRVKREEILRGRSDSL